MSLQGKVAVVTGGGSGMGADIARKLVNSGAKVVINGRNSKKLSDVAKDIDPEGNNIACISGDIGKHETRQNIIDTALSSFNGLDILVNNAGIFFPKPFLEHTESDLEQYLNVLRGYFFLTQLAVKNMLNNRHSAIINIGSMWSLQGIAATPNSAAATAKGGVHALTRNLAIEFAHKNIRVNAIAPAVVETPLYDPIMTRQQLSTFKSFHPLGRNGVTNDISRAVLFLADEDSSGWITGVILPVDGGVTAGRH
ncbi:SDR family NAD(P)-dependent oxidoreductase [Sulfuriflexus mobilis]|uniref:SDR family NAD(P)-dependent oxidoreductase n=1 Tax=Sulfuriflexus mobilis TaxID=1811807 RepID=UPI000F81F931|nr:SDR family oxidoreductase [Sulfuriflexus mobilis]